MGVVGVSLIVASVVCLLACPVGWLPQWGLRLRKFFRSSFTLRRGYGGDITEGPGPPGKKQDIDAKGETEDDGLSAKTTSRDAPDTSSITNRTARDAAAMPPPPPPTIQQPPTPQEPAADVEEQTTPKANAAQPPQPVPSFSLSDEPSPSSLPSSSASFSGSGSASSAAASVMPPPPRPSPSPNRLPQFPAPASAQRARGPIPNRNPLAPPSSGLAPPPTHSSKPQKPSRKVVLSPGRSPLDWARISGPGSDLRGLPSSTPYLRVTPSMLKKQNGRKGHDAWMGLNGKVYNITPYAEFHPGGVGELMRGAGRDGTKLFGEIHPWVNYDTMLSSCLIGLLVDEPEGNEESEMDKMD